MALVIGVTPQTFNDWQRVEEKAVAGGIYPQSLYVDDQGRIWGEAYDGVKGLGLWGGERAGMAGNAYASAMFDPRLETRSDGFDLPPWLREIIATLRKALADLAAMFGVSPLIAMMIILAAFILFLLIFRG